MEELPDWDLLAVVRSCTATATTTATSPPPPKQEEHFHGFPTLFEPPTTSFSGSQQELQDICNPRLIHSPVSSSSSSLVAARSFLIGENPLLRPFQVVFRAPPAVSTSQVQRTKKRKNLVKKVCHVPAEGLSNDMWAWRKYGQKPIKGSPYPRGYYRCSSSKGCLARKQVERNRSDPKLFIVTYTGEHNHSMPTHRNSLAGSTRQKSLSGDATSHVEPTSSSPMESKTEEDNDMGISDLMLNDDFYVEFERIDGGEDSDCFPDHFSPSMEFPWLVNSSSTVTAAGGL